MAAIAVMILVILCIFLQSDEPLSVKTILRYTPQNRILAAGILLAFFALKSLTVVFPLSILYFASGILFESGGAVLISTVGLAITLTIPYWLGRASGRTIIQEMCEKYPKIEQLKKYQDKNVFFACFITRIVGILPGDLVSLYFGACDTPYLRYLLAGVAGSLLSIVTNTLLGEKINDPFSVEFMLVLLCRILVSVGAVGINYWFNKKNRMKA